MKTLLITKHAILTGLFLSSIALFSPSVAFSWTQDIIEATEAMEKGTANDQQKALILMETNVVNEMRIKGVISDGAFQASHHYYDTISQEEAVKAAHQHGAELKVQQRTNKVFDAGTDSDYITNAKNKEQVQAMQQSYNENFDAKIRQLSGDAGTGKNWIKKNDVDFMVNPDAGSKITDAEFADVAGVNNDAYVRPDAARFEAKSRSTSGEKPTLQETKAYIDEMRDFIHKKRNSSKQYATEIIDLNKNPKSQQQGTPEYAKRMSLEAQLLQSQAHQAKYFNRINDASKILADQAHTVAPATSNLPEVAKKRAASDGVSTAQRQINAATAASTADNLMTQGKLNEALLLSIGSSRQPKLTAQNNERIANIISDLPPSQQGELIIKLLDSNCVDKNVTEDLKLRLRAHNSSKQTGGTKTPQRSTKLGKAGKVAGLAGDILSIQDQLKKAEQGSHLFFNIEEDDSESMKNLKRSAVALTELAPIPIIDSLERGWKTDERIKREILRKIANGEDVDPVLITAEVFAEIGINTVGSLTIEPLLSGIKAMDEGYMASRDLFKNWQDDAVRAESEQLQKEKMSGIMARIEAIDLGFISATSTGKDGKISYVLDDVQHGDAIDFTVERSDRWTSQYKVQWLIKDSHKQVIATTPFKDAASPTVHILHYFNNNLRPGHYVVVFRIFDAASQKMMDSTDYGFTVSGTFAMGRLSAKQTNGKSYQGRVKHGNKLRFTITPVGTWKNQTIEWLIDGDAIKTGSADSRGITHVTVGFDKNYSIGNHTVSVRAIKGKKIIAVKKMTFQVEENVDYIARGRKRHKQTIRSLVEATIPTCLGNAKTTITQELLSTPIEEKEALAWGKPQKIEQIQKDYKKAILTEWLQGFPALPEDECTISYAQAVATGASSHGLGPQDSLFAQLKDKLKKKKKKDPAMAKCLQLQKSMDSLKQNYRKNEDQYLNTVSSFMRGTANHPTFQRLYGKTESLASQLESLQAAGDSAPDKESYAVIYAKFTSTNSMYKSAQTELKTFISKVSVIGDFIKNHTAAKDCQPVVDYVNADRDRKDIFDTIVGGGAGEGLSGRCTDLLRAEEKYNNHLQQYKDLECPELIKKQAAK